MEPRFPESLKGFPAAESMREMQLQVGRRVAAGGGVAAQLITCYEVAVREALGMVLDFCMKHAAGFFDHV